MVVVIGFGKNAMKQFTCYKCYAFIERIRRNC